MNPEIEKIIANLPPDDQVTMKEHLDASKKTAQRAARAAIMARNFSHNIGENVVTELEKKDDLGDESDGIYGFVKNWHFESFRPKYTARIDMLINGEITFKEEVLRINALDRLSRSAGLEELINLSNQNADMERVLLLSKLQRGEIESF